MHSYEIKTSARGTVIYRSGNCSFLARMENGETRQFLADWQAGATVTDASSAPLPYSADALAALNITPLETT